MKAPVAIVALLLALISGSSCYAARPVHNGISPAALAVVRPVFVPWKECNAAISETVYVALHGSDSNHPADPETITEYRGEAFQVVVSIKLEGSLARNAHMKDAVHSLKKLFWIKQHYAGQFESPCHLGDGPGCYERYYNTSTPDFYSATSQGRSEPYATRFWYDLDHTA